MHNIKVVLNGHYKDDQADEKHKTRQAKVLIPTNQILVLMKHPKVSIVISLLSY